MRELLRVDNPVKVIGTRHGEKLFETLLTREERSRAEDQGNYFRVPSDNRDLNYNLYFSEGNKAVHEQEDYHSHNTRRLGIDEMKQQLLRLPEITEWMERRDRKKQLCP